MLKVEEHEKNINDLSELLKVEGVDTAKVSLIIQSLRDNYNEVSTSIADTSKQIEKINGLNEGLRSANMELLSKLGTQVVGQAQTEHATGKETEIGKEETTRTLDELADEFLK